MKRLKILSLSAVLIVVCFFSGCFLSGGNVSDKTYTCTEVKVVFSSSCSFSDSEKQILKSKLESYKDSTITFNSNGSLTTTFPYIMGRAWSVEGNKIAINGGIQYLNMSFGKITVNMSDSDFKATFYFSQK